MKKWILSHRKIITVAIISLAVILTCVSAILINQYKQSEFEFVELLYYTSQIISALFVISGVVIAVWQYYLSCTDSRRDIDVVCVQKAIDLSEYYKDNILSYVAPIEFIFRNTGIMDIISKIDKSQIKHFDEKELNLYLTNDDVAKLKEIQESENFFKVVIKANSLYNLGLSKEVITMSHREQEKSVVAIDRDVLATFLGKIITRVLNNMEYFALHFTHNVADESVVYKSLHQTYIDLVQLLYYNIARKNPLSTTKYFTNIIELYELWNNRAIKDEENFANGVRNLSNKGTVVENKH